MACFFICFSFFRSFFQNSTYRLVLCRSRLDHIAQSANVLVMDKSAFIEKETRGLICPSLNVIQIKRLMELFTPDKYVLSSTTTAQFIAATLTTRTMLTRRRYTHHSHIHSHIMCTITRVREWVSEWVCSHSITNPPPPPPTTPTSPQKKN